NYESISVYYSWIDSREAQRVANEQDRFDKIWENRDANLRIYDLPEAVRRNLIAFTVRSPRPYAAPPSVHPAVDRWRHQRDAAAIFLETRHGILEMATGTGKTRTALNILEELCERSLVNSAV